MRLTPFLSSFYGCVVVVVVFGLFVICLDGRTMHVLQQDSGLTSLALQSKYAHTCDMQRLLKCAH